MKVKDERKIVGFLMTFSQGGNHSKVLEWVILFLYGIT